MRMLVATQVAKEELLMRIEVAGTVTLEDVRRANRIMFPNVFSLLRMQLGPVRGCLLPLILLGMFIVTVFLQLAPENPDSRFLNAEGKSVLRLCSLLALAGLAFKAALYSPYMIRRRQYLSVLVPRSYRENKKEYEQVLTVIDNQGLVRTLQTGERKVYTWDHFHLWHIDDKQILLMEKYARDGEAVRKHPTKPPLTVCHILPRHSFTESQFQELREFLMKRLSASTGDEPIQPNPTSFPSNGITKPVSWEMQNRPDESP
jgi:hypothetical protein